MSHGDGIGRDDIPDIHLDPKYIEGPAGGPAMPTGGLSEEEKEAYDEASDFWVYYATGTAAVAVVAGAVTEGAGGVIFGLISAGASYLAQYFSDLAEDPPQPHEQVVTFEPRVSRPPGMDDPVLAPSGIVVQRSVFAGVSAGGLLDAIERQAGAQQAGDLNWAVTHHGVVSQCRRTLVIDVATLAAAMYAAGQAISGTKYDVKLKSGAGGVRAWIQTPGMEATMLEAMNASGFTTDEASRVIAWWKTDPKYYGREITCSRLFIASARRIHAAITRLAG